MRELENQYKRVENLTRKSCSLLDICELEQLLQKLEELTTQPMLTKERDQLAIQVAEWLKDIARKNEKIGYYHAKQ